MAEKRIKISSIKIKNFRSLKNETILPLDLNIFVGLNDAGKSNVLKALNLFFNGQTDYGREFLFSRDFTHFYDKSSHQSKEISISIKFDIPSTYSSFGEYSWTKIWKTDGLVSSKILSKDGKEPNPKSRIPGALNRIKFRYVPAVKSKEYFKTLLGDLYEAVFSSIDNPLDKSVNTFSKELRKYTESLSEDIKRRLGLDSALAFPEDLNDIFKALIFETKNDEKEESVPLDARGDGIQAFHIPIILKYISQEDKKSRRRGSMKVETIWGFEEPENGLEILKTFQMATDFVNYSKELQIFVSTHSPAFYMKKELDTAKIFYVCKKGDTDQTTISTSISTSSIAENMGLMPIVAPFIEEKSRELEEIKKITSENVFLDLPTIFVEGKSDIEILQIAIKNHSPILQKMLDDNKLRISCKSDGAGCKRLADWVLAWTYCGFKSKAYALFDNDKAGLEAKHLVENNEAFRQRQNGVQVKTQTINPSELIIELMYNKEISFNFEIEHLLSTEFWKKLIDKGYAEERSNSELSNMFARHLNVNTPLIETIKTVVGNDDIIETIVRFKPKKLKKNKIVAFLKEQDNVSEATKGLEKTLKQLELFFEDN